MAGKLGGEVQAKNFRGLDIVMEGVLRIFEGNDTGIAGDGRLCRRIQHDDVGRTEIVVAGRRIIADQPVKGVDCRDLGGREVARAALQP